MSVGIQFSPREVYYGFQSIKAPQISTTILHATSNTWYTPTPSTMATTLSSCTTIQRRGASYTTMHFFGFLISFEYEDTGVDAML